LPSWDPFDAPHRILARFGGRFENGWPGDALLDTAEAHHLPPADVYEDAEGWHVLVELPGVHEAGLAVTLLDDCLIVEAERTLPNGNNIRLHEIEATYGALRREFLLPSRAQPARALADLTAGVLHVLVPRSHGATNVARPLDVTAHRADNTAALRAASLPDGNRLHRDR
jgi:HSP20 family molecular chaperone IbpA